MGWERRRGAHYFYRHVRVGGRPRRDYYGRGAAAELAAKLMTEARLAREADAAALRDRAQALTPVERALDELDAPCRLLTEAALGAAGYARRHYEWKRIHGRNERPNPV
jgi:hypothetical protein